MNWVFFAIGSAFFAGLTAILGKLGVEGINSNLATFIRTIVVLLVTAGIISARNEWQLPQHIASKTVYLFNSFWCCHGSILALLLSRIANGTRLLGCAH